ncbi:MAG: hypothetical protein ACP5N7_05595 [Candidatus Pacearchaeota archaeon]
MAKIKSAFEVEDKPKFEFPIYSKPELQELNRLFEEKYNNLKTVIDQDNWMKDEGALSKYGAVFVDNYRQELKFVKGGEDYYYSVCNYPTKYALLQNKLEQAVKLQGKKEWAIKKDLERLTENMDIENETQLTENGI